MAITKGSPGKTFGETSDTFGGGLVVWDGIKDTVRYAFGARLLDTLSEGQVIVTGTPVALDKVNKTVTICQAFRVYEDTVGGYTTVKVNKWDSLPEIEANDVIMVCPATQAGTGEGVTATAVDKTASDHDVVTVGTDALGVLKEGDILVYAAAVGAGEDQLVIATDLMGDNLVIGSGDTAADKCVVNDIVFEGSVMKHRLPPFPTYLTLPEVAGQRYMFNEE